MARGWESKSVEAQQAEREERRPAAAEVTPEEMMRRAHRRTLELARARAAADLAKATRPAHRTMLQAALDALDAQLAAVEPE